MNDIISRIRKILAKTEQAGCTEAEAATAMATASRLMAEHNLSMSEVETTDSTAAEPWAEEDGHEFRKWTLECSLASGIVKRYFMVEGFITDRWTGSHNVKVYRFFGKQSNVETARWAFASLLEAFDRLFQEHRRRTRCPGRDRRAFVAGVAKGFGDKMAEERETLVDERDVVTGKSGGTALALRSIEQETQAQLKQKYGKMGTYGGGFAPTRDSGGARNAGYAAGRKLNLARPIGQSTRRSIGS